MALPQFSRNYTRSGAYENPITPVDTQSGAIWANAIQGIGNTVAGPLQTLSAQAETKVKETQKILDENAKFVLTENNAFIANASKAGLKNPSFAKAGMDIIRLKSQAYFDMKAGKEGAVERFTKYSSKLGELIELGKEVQKEVKGERGTGKPKEGKEEGKPKEETKTTSTGLF